MTRLAIVLLGLASLASAKPTFLSIPLTYAASLTPGTQVDTNSEALHAPEIAAARSAVESPLLRGRQSLIRDGASPILTSSAPLGADGRVVDTPEVTAAKKAHAVAHVHERINLANEIARSGGGALDSPDVANSDPDGKVLDAPEVAVARTDEKIDLANEAARSGDVPHVVNGRVVPLVLGNGVIAALVPIGPDGRSLSVPEVVEREDQNLANDVRSVDALAVAGPALAYGRLIY